MKTVRGQSPRDGNYKKYSNNHWEDDRPRNSDHPREGGCPRDCASSKNASDSGGCRLDTIYMARFSFM